MNIECYKTKTLNSINAFIFSYKGKAFETNTSRDSDSSIKTFLKHGTKKTSLA